MKTLNELMEELEELNLSELFKKEVTENIKKEILIKILELKEKGKSDSEVIDELKKYLKED